MRCSLLLLAVVGLSGCPINANATGQKCSEQLSALKGLCPINSLPKLQADASGSCGADGKYTPASNSGELGGTCESKGACMVACIATSEICTCGVKTYSRDKIECRDPCPDGCGNGVCDGSETKQSCPGDCAPTPTSSGGGSGAAGSGSSSAAARGTSGAAGSVAVMSSGTGGASGNGTPVKSAISTEGALCSTCGCVKAMDSWYVIRTDGRILREVADSAKTQTPIIDDATGRPLENAVAAAAMPAAGCALLGDGTVSCWREAANGNTSGQLGNGTTDTNAQPLYRATKVLVDAGQPLTDVSAFALSQGLGSDACVVTNTGKLYCWGDLTWLVNGGKALPSPYAVPITTNGNDPLMPVVQASIASSAACALIQGAGSNEVRCWGNNSFAVLGQGDTQNRQYATKVSGLSSPSAIVVGEGNWNGGGDARSTACAIDGSQVLCWGRNASGATGVAMTTDPILSPTAVVIQDGSILPAPTIVHAGANSFCAYEDTRTVWCWGAGSKTSAGNVGATNVVALGAVFSPSQPAFLSSDGTYHMGTSDSRAPNCNAL